MWGLGFACHRRGDQPAESGITLEQKIEHFSAHFFAVFKNHRGNTRGLPKVKTCSKKFHDLGNFYLGIFDYGI